MGNLQCAQEGTLASVPGGLAGEAALCPQDVVAHSAEKADQTQVLPLSLHGSSSRGVTEEPYLCAVGHIAGDKTVKLICC